MLISQAAKNREKYLELVLRFDSQYERVFTAFERIYIQKERAELLQNGDWKIPETLEQKVQDTLTRIVRINWEPYK
ncbi:MAG: hypothetical protein Q4A00_05720 [Flavobacteriaceae bacterium]|nr:hypothetical protein [Flavobacteriaceae bacterium]